MIPFLFPAARIAQPQSLKLLLTNPSENALSAFRTDWFKELKWRDPVCLIPLNTQGLDMSVIRFPSRVSDIMFAPHP
jgi:hypothetical protein